jgi:hypothetical protein
MPLPKRSGPVQKVNARPVTPVLRRSSHVRDYKMSPGVEVIENTSKFSSQVCLQAPT